MEKRNSKVVTKKKRTKLINRIWIIPIHGSFHTHPNFVPQFPSLPFRTKERRRKKKYIIPSPSLDSSSSPPTIHHHHPSPLPPALPPPQRQPSQRIQFNKSNQIQQLRIRKRQSNSRIQKTRSRSNSPAGNTLKRKSRTLVFGVTDSQTIISRIRSGNGGEGDAG